MNLSEIENLSVFFIYLFFFLVLFYGENIGYKIALSIDWYLF